MTAKFDLSKVSLSEVAEIVRDGTTLHAFRNHLLSFAGRVPPEVPPDERERRLRELAETVVQDWQTLEKRLPRRVLSTIGAGAAAGAEDLAKDVAKGAVTGALGLGLGATVGGLTAPMVLASLAPMGVPIVFGLVRTTFQWLRRDSIPGPYRLLSRVHEAGGVQLAASVPILG